MLEPVDPVPEPEQLMVNVGDIELAVLHWRCTHPTSKTSPILLLHATGFHSHCWKQVVQYLPGRSVYAADLRYHGASGSKGRPNWAHMAQDVARLIDALALTDIIGVGHSLGGYLTATVAAQHPDLFRHLVLIDPVIFSAQRYAEVAQTPSDFEPSEHPTAKRKNAWHNPQEMFERFAERPPFDTWRPDVLLDYCNHALAPASNDELRELACNPVDEAGIYMNQSGNEIILERIENIAAPVTLLRAPPGDGRKLDFSLSPTAPDLAARLPRCEEFYLEDLNHFIPMQRPDLVAQHILAVP